MGKTSIEWCSDVWNPVTGCTKVSPGCKNCYAERMAKRLQAMDQPNYANGFDVTVQPDMLRLPFKWKTSRRIFVNSMSDLFHDGVTADYIGDVFRVMGEAHWHRFLILTKRADRLAQLSPQLPWPSNVWMGVSVENRDYLGRVDILRHTGAVVKFLSLEPLLGPIGELFTAHFGMDGIDWVIAGGESGPGARPMNPNWVRSIRDQCVDADIPFFFKQWGGVNKKKAGRTLDGRTWDEMPEVGAENAG